MTPTNSEYPPPPRVMAQVLRFARLLTTIGDANGPKLDRERVCYLVTDEEWHQLVNYQLGIKYINGSDNPNGMVSMSILGVEIVKRSAIMRAFYEE